MQEATVVYSIYFNANLNSLPLMLTYPMGQMISN